MKSILKFMPRDANKIEFFDTDNNLTCYSWDVCSGLALPEIEGFNHLFCRALMLQEDFVCIDNHSHCKGQMVLFQDAQHKKEYPERFVKVPCFDNFEAFVTYARERGEFSFTLEDTSRFRKSGKIFQGAHIYQEIKTGNYWYLDNLHKSHYEVFDRNCCHIGEAGLDGELDRSKKAPTRRLNWD